MRSPSTLLIGGLKSRWVRRKSSAEIGPIVVVSWTVVYGMFGGCCLC